MSIYVPRHFQIYELIPYDIYWKYVKLKKIKMWLMFDRNLLITLDQLRDQFGPMVINDWWWQGENQYRGWRPMDCRFGSVLSQHKFGRGTDLKPKDCTSQECRDFIRKNPEKFPLISAIERGVNWLHVDTRNWDRTESGILFFKP